MDCYLVVDQILTAEIIKPDHLDRLYAVDCIFPDLY